MNADVVIIGAGPAGIFTALEMLKKGSKQKIVMVEKGQSVEKRHCPKDKTGYCMAGRNHLQKKDCLTAVPNRYAPRLAGERPLSFK